MIVLDTDVLIELFDKGSKEGDRALQEILQSGDNVSTTAISLHEVTYGLEKYARPVDAILRLPVLSYTKEDAHLSARVELDRERKGVPIRRADAMIAAITINNGARLYTMDFKHFKPLRTHGLRLFP